MQRLPAAVTLKSLEDALKLIGKKGDYALYLKLKAKLTAFNPKLADFAANEHLTLLKYAGEWDKLLAMADFMLHHPKPKIYVRQVTATGLDTKFIEHHVRILTRILLIVMDPQDYDADVTGSGIEAFCRRFHFRLKPHLVRMRFLDQEAARRSFAFAVEDFVLDDKSFAVFNPAVERVIIVENEITYLSLPPVPKTLAIFGHGYGFETFKGVEWLSRVEIAYWGDLDKPGFEILNELRETIAPLQVTSLLMDLKTLKAYPERYVKDSVSRGKNLSSLTSAEGEAYAALCSNVLGVDVRLEQELIAYETVETALKAWQSSAGEA